MRLIDLKQQLKKVRADIDNRIKKVLEHTDFISGPEVSELEQKLAEIIGVKHCLTCSSGTDALLLSLMAHDIGPGDAVLTSSFSFIAGAEAIALLGATPIFIDIDSRTFNINPREILNTIDNFNYGIMPTMSYPKRLTLRGIIAVDMFGLATDYDMINKIAEKNNLFVIEDGAQSFGAIYKGRKAGNLAELATLSFFPTKPLGCYGDGGAVLTDNDQLAEKIKSLREHGKGKSKYRNLRIGINGRLDTIQAAILLAKLTIFKKEMKTRQTIAKRYCQELKGAVITPKIPTNCVSAWAQFSVISDKSAKLITNLKNENIPTNIYYPCPLHLQPAFYYLSYMIGDLPTSEMVSTQIFSLPMHPYLSEEEQSKIIDVIGRSS